MRPDESENITLKDGAIAGVSALQANVARNMECAATNCVIGIVKMDRGELQ